MSDLLTIWKQMQEHILAAQKSQLEAISKMMGMGENFDNALDAARKIADANINAWQTWLSVWGNKK